MKTVFMLGIEGNCLQLSDVVGQLPVTPNTVLNAPIMFYPKVMLESFPQPFTSLSN